MVLPHVASSNREGAPLLTAGDYQFGVWYDLAGELRVGRITRGVHRWGVDHQEYTFAGTPRTTLNLPTIEDEHNYPTIAVDGNGHLHVWANMHSEPLHAVKSTTPHTTGDWLATAGWTSATGDLPGVGTSCSYPTPVTFPDGSLLVYFRDVGISGRGDSHIWRRTPTGTTWGSAELLFQGLTVPGAGGPGPWPSGTPGSGSGVDDNSNWNAYPSNWLVESPRSAHPGRLHLAWTWRRWGNDALYQAAGGQGVAIGPGESAPADGERTQDWPAYGYSDDKGLTWRAIDGTPASLPFTPLNNTAFRLGTTDATNGYANGIGLAVDYTGLPHLVMSSGSTAYVRRNATNTAWVQTTIANPVDGFTHISLQMAFWLRGNLWMFKLAAPTQSRRARLFQLSGGTGTVALSGVIGIDVLPHSWTPGVDLEAYRRFETIECLAPDGNRPRVFRFGRGPRAVAHVA